MKLLGVSLQVHKWIALVVGVQVLFWTAGGVVMTAIPIERVRSEHHLAKAKPAPIDFSRTLIAGLTLMFALRAWVDCRSIIVNSAGVLVPQLAFYGGHAVLNVLLAFALAKRYGIEGVAWATVLTALVTSTWGYPWMVRKYIFGTRPTAHAGS